MRNYLLVLHCIQIPYAPNSIELGHSQHVGLIRAPVETGYWRLIWCQSTSYSLLLNVTKQFGEVLLNHPDFNAFSSCCHQIATYCRFPNNLRRRVLVSELLYFYKALACLRLLRLLVWRCSRLCQTENLHFVVGTFHIHATNSYSYVGVRNVLEGKRVDAVVEV